MDTPPDNVLYHAIFGSIIDQTEMTPFLLQPATDYFSSIKQATRMLENRGFDTTGSDTLRSSERERAVEYIRRAYDYCFNEVFPFVCRQLEGLALLRSPNDGLYRSCLSSIAALSQVLDDRSFRALLLEDPRHLLLLASSRKYSFVFSGYHGRDFAIPAYWQEAACCLLKVIHLIKSVEEDSQDINDVVQLGFFFEDRGIRLDDLYRFDWDHPAVVPDSKPSQRAFVKIAMFFHRLGEYLSFSKEKGCLVFNSGDGVKVEIAEVKARLKSPESMVTKLGKTVEGAAFDIRDILAITFILKDKDETLKLFHALQKQGVILQDNTVSTSITQTLFDDPAGMQEAVRRLMISLAKGRGRDDLPEEGQVAASAAAFYEALGKNADANVHTSGGHRKFQCKIGFSVPIHRATDTNEILIPGTPQYSGRDSMSKKTEQHTIGVELRISDVQSWQDSEQTGDSHHDAYKFRQFISVMNRLFKNMFHFPAERLDQLRRDQSALFS